MFKKSRSLVWVLGSFISRESVISFNCTDFGAQIQCSFFIIIIALTALFWAQCVCWNVDVKPPTPSCFSCWATRFISTCLQKYRSMPELDLWKTVEIKSSRNFSSVCWSVCLLWNAVEEVCVCAWAHICAKTYVFIAAWHVCLWRVTFPCEDVFIIFINYLLEFLFFFWLSYMQICTKNERKKTNCVDIYVLHIVLLSSRIVSCK